MDTIPALSLVAGAAGAAFLLFCAGTPSFTRFLYRNRLGKTLREPADPEKLSLLSSFARARGGTPTMAGMLILAVIFVVLGGVAGVAHFLPNLAPPDFFSAVRGQLYLPVFTLAAAGALGMIDDFFHLRPRGRRLGIGRAPKVFWLSAFAAVGAWWFFAKLGWSTIHVPSVGDFELGLWYLPLFFAVFWLTPVAVAASEGFDGLTAGLLIFAFSAFGVIAFAKSLILLAIFCAVVAGAVLGFLWFNLAPARFLMGNVGLLGLGATLGVVAMLLDSALVLPVIGAVFFVELFSLGLQKFSVWARRGQKVFLRAPLHAHFEQLGWPESRVVARFWIVGAVAGVVGAILGVLGMGL